MQTYTLVRQKGDQATDFANIFEKLKEMTKTHMNQSLDPFLPNHCYKHMAFGNFEEQLPKKPVGRLSINCRPTDSQQLADCILGVCRPTVGVCRPTVGRLSADSLPLFFKITWHSVVFFIIVTQKPAKRQSNNSSSTNAFHSTNLFLFSTLP